MTFNGKWNRYFMKMAHLAAEMSKDTTKVGCVLVGEDKNVLSTGFNGFPKGVQENEVRLLPQYKLRYTCHAEQNALDLAKSDIKNAILFCTHEPCCDCAKSIIQKGIKKIYFAQKLDDTRWHESIMASNQMLKEAGVEIFQLNLDESSSVEEETSKMKSLQDNISTGKVKILPQIQSSSTEQRQGQILLDMNGQIQKALQQRDIPQNGTIWTTQKQLSKLTSGERNITQMQASYEIPKCYLKASQIW